MTGTVHLVSERALQDAIIQVAKLNRWLVYHTHDSRHSAAGFPDLVLIRAPAVLFIELKSQAGKLTAEQARWLEELNDSGLTAVVWRPSDLDTAIARLQEKP